MRIAQVAPLYERVPPVLYGGTERVVAYLTDELVRMGHDVTLFASGDSETGARLVPACPRALWRDADVRDTLPHHVRLMEMVFQDVTRFDVIHFHTDWLHFPLLRRHHVPSVTTLHGMVHPHDLRALFEEYRELPLVSISNAQRHPIPGANWRATVYHGLPIDDIPFTPGGGQGGYLAFLGRMSRDKGVIAAIQVAHEVGIPLRIAAKTDPADRDYYERELRGLIDGTFIQYVGEIGDEEKWKFLGGALCLLFPIDWPEPFGLVTIEALACGTPVVARPCGAVPEIVRDGETGWLGDSVADLAAGVRRVEAIDRVRCREVVTQQFSVTAMASGYERVYAELL
jgi:glycosyltransferase involved in cell wall biosynthesis